MNYYSPELAFILTVVISVCAFGLGWYARQAKHERDKRDAELLLELIPELVETSNSHLQSDSD